MYELGSDELSLKKYSKELEQEKIILNELELELSQKIKDLEKTKSILGDLVSKNNPSEESMLEKEFIDKISQTLSSHYNDIEKIKAQHEREIHKKHSTIKELKQEKIIFTQMNQTLEETIKTLENTNRELQTKLSRVSNHSKLSQQANQILIKTFN